MKMKLNWGTSIVIVMVLFMIFILSFVYKAVFIDKYEHHLVSEDYYKEELHYQEEIDKLNKATLLTQNISLSNSEKGITVLFPSNMDFNNISGKISFLRLSNNELDFETKINLTSNSMTIDDTYIVSGKWEVRVDWKYGEEEYLFEESWFY